MQTLDWSQFTVNIPINAPISAIENAWSTQKGLESWFLQLAEFRNPAGVLRDRTIEFQVGDTYQWKWHGWPNDIAETGKILPAQTDELVRFSFGRAGIVSVKIVVQQQETILQLTQEEIPTDEVSRNKFHVGCKTGWTFYLLNLKSILLGGMDLRNKNSSLNMD